MDVVLLGTGSPLPAPDRAGPATLVRAAGRDLLFDCGRGVLMRAAAAGASAATLSRLLLTHLHSDHTTDLADVITSRWILAPVPTPLQIVGPPGTQRFVDRTLALLEDDIGYRLAHHDDLGGPPKVEVQEVADGLVLEEDGLRISAAPTDHKPVHPTIGYRIEAEDGVVAIAGDTIPCEGLARICQGADVYVQTVVRPSLIEQIPFARLNDILDYHSSNEDAGRTAAEAGVRKLVLTHPVPAPAPGTEQEWIDEARAHFDGEVILATDLLTVSTTT